MKVVILGTFRTRSSYLLDTICNHYKLAFKFEPYDDLTHEVYETSFKKLPAENWKRYAEQVNLLSDQLITESNYGLKIFSNAYFNSFIIDSTLSKKKIPTLLKTDKLDFISNFKLHHYDQIYFVNRKSCIDNAISYVYGTHTSLLYSERERKLVNHYKNKPIKLHYDHFTIQTMVLKWLLMDIYEKDLQKTKLPYIKLDYDEIPSYVGKNFPNTTSQFIDTELDYANLVSNYHQFVDGVEKAIGELKDCYKELS